MNERQERVLGKAWVIFLTVVVFLFGFSLLWTGYAQSSDGIQIGTYNLEFFTDLNPSTGGWCESHNHRTETDIKALASFIDSLDIEVLALQEVENGPALDKLLNYMPEGKYAYIVSRQSGLCQRVAVLYQPQSVSLTYTNEIPLSLGHQGLRNGLVVDGKVLPDGFDFTLVVVHLKAFSDYDSRKTREQQLKMLGDWVQAYLQNENNDPDLILAGDFNEYLLTDQNMFSLLDENSNLRVLTADAPSTVCTPPGSYYTKPVDHIIISSNAQNEYEGTTEFCNYFRDSTLAYRDTYSDHCVLWSDFSTEDLDGPQTESVNTAPSNSTQVATPVVINEVELNPPCNDNSNSCLEWVELYNSSDEAADIGGWTLTTTHGNTVTLMIPFGTVIQPHGYFVLHHPRWLDNNDEMVILRDSAGREVDRTPVFSDTSNGSWSWQRYPNGVDTDSLTDWVPQLSTEGRALLD